MEMESFRKDGILILKPGVRRIDATDAIDFKSKMSEFVKNGSVDIVINLSEVDYVDSSGLGALVSVLKEIGTRGEIKLCEVSNGVISILKLTRLDKVFDIHRSEKGAIDCFKGQVH